jgi:hypothetical protein
VTSKQEFKRDTHKRMALSPPFTKQARQTTMEEAVPTHKNNDFRGAKISQKYKGFS